MIASPWVLGYSGELTPEVNAVLAGVVLVSAELTNVEGHERAEEWVDMIVGLWLTVSPLLLGFESMKAAALNSVAAGLLTMLLAGWALSPLDGKIKLWWGRHVTWHRAREEGFTSLPHTRGLSSTPTRTRRQPQAHP